MNSCIAFFLEKDSFIPRPALFLTPERQALNRAIEEKGVLPRILDLLQAKDGVLQRSNYLAFDLCAGLLHSACEDALIRVGVGTSGRKLVSPRFEQHLLMDTDGRSPMQAYEIFHRSRRIVDQVTYTLSVRHLLQPSNTLADFILMLPHISDHVEPALHMQLLENAAPATFVALAFNRKGKWVQALTTLTAFGRIMADGSVQYVLDALLSAREDLTSDERCITDAFVSEHLKQLLKEDTVGNGTTRVSTPLPPTHSSDNTSTDTPLRLYTYRGHSGTVKAITWSPDGKRIASAEHQIVRVWDATDGSRMYIYRGLAHAGFYVRAVAWSSDGKYIASGHDDQTVQVWNAPDGSHVYIYHGYSRPIYVVAWSSGGKYVTSESSDDQTMQAWNAPDGSHIHNHHSYDLGDFEPAMAWSPNSNRIASVDNQTVQVWNVIDGSYVYTYRSHSHLVRAVAWSPDGKYIASGSDDKTVQVWDTTNGSHIYTHCGHSHLVMAVAWSPDGKYIASSGGNTVQVWDATDGSHISTYRGHSHLVRTVAWSPDGKYIASSSDDETVQVWDTANGSHVSTYRGHSHLVRTVAWSPDGKYIISGSSDGTVQVWNTTNGSHIYTYPIGRFSASSVAWSPDSKCIAFGIRNTVQVWQAPS